jgi:hypothetical protein
MIHITAELEKIDSLSELLENAILNDSEDMGAGYVAMARAIRHHTKAIRKLCEDASLGKEASE